MLGRAAIVGGRKGAVNTLGRAHERRRLRVGRASRGPSRLLRRPLHRHEDDRRARGRRHSLRPGDQRRALDRAGDDLDGDRALCAPPRLPALGRRARSHDRDALSRASRPTATRWAPSSSTRTTSSRRCPRRTWWVRARRSTARSSGYGTTVRSRSCSSSTTGQRTCRTTSSTPSARTGSRRSRRLSAASRPTRPPRSKRRARGTGRRSNASRRCSWRRCSRSSRVSGLRDDTVFAFLSDHGESWGERFPDKQDVQGVYHMHGAALYDEIVNVPLILSAPGRLDPAVVRSRCARST